MNPSHLVLPPLSALYGAAMRTRLAAYKKGLLSVSHLRVPVISVGNITVGGTGKTPVVEWICRQLASEGRKPCVLTRGYGRQKPKTRVVVSDGKNINTSESRAGDEAFLLAQNLRGIAAVVSDVDRTAAGVWATEHLGADVFVLDDGFQHLRLARNLNILTIDAMDPWGGDELLPYGRLREPLAEVARADCIVITRADGSRDLSVLKHEIWELAGDRPIFEARMQMSGIKQLNGKLVDLPDEPLAAFCAIGNPNSFFNDLRTRGCDIALQRSFVDHHRYDQEDADELINAATGAGAKSLITTAKDAVKLQLFNFSLPCYVYEIRVEIQNEESFLSLIRNAISSL